jgi:hypothetical protein
VVGKGGSNLSQPVKAEFQGVDGGAKSGEEATT